jgi:DNA gyrase subunit A
VRFTGRSAQGVTLFKVAEGEQVVSVAWLIDDDGDEEAIEEGGLEDAGADDAASAGTSPDAAAPDADGQD